MSKTKTPPTEPAPAAPTGTTGRAVIAGRELQRADSATLLRAEAERFRRKAEQLSLAAHLTPPVQVEVSRIHSHLLRAEVFKDAAALVERHFE